MPKHTELFILDFFIILIQKLYCSMIFCTIQIGVFTNTPLIQSFITIFVFLTFQSSRTEFKEKPKQFYSKKVSKLSFLEKMDEKPPPPYNPNPPMAGFAPPPHQPQINQPLPGQPPVVQVVHTQQVVHTKPAPFGRDPVPTICPHCSQSVSFNRI